MPTANSFTRFVMRAARLVDEPRFFLANALTLRLRRLAAAGTSMDFQSLAELEAFLRARSTPPQEVHAAGALFDRFLRWRGTPRQLHRAEAGGAL